MDLKAILALGAEISCGSVIHDGKLLGEPKLDGTVDLTAHGVAFVEAHQAEEPEAPAPKSAPRKSARKAAEPEPAAPTLEDDAVGLGG